MVLMRPSCKSGFRRNDSGTPDSAGVPKDFTKNTLQVPYNDIGAMTEAIKVFKDDVAAVIMEPVLGISGLSCQKRLSGRGTRCNKRK